MADIVAICDAINECVACGTPKDSLFKKYVLQLLCAQLGQEGGAPVYDWEVLCDPNTGSPVVVRYMFIEDDDDDVDAKYRHKSFI